MGSFSRIGGVKGGEYGARWDGETMKFEMGVLVRFVAGWMDGDDHEGGDEKWSGESGE